MMNINPQMLGLLAGVLLLSTFSCFFLIRFLGAKNIVDRPSDRGNHATPTPRGGGIGVLLSIVAGFFLLLYFRLPSPSPLVVCGAVVLATLSFFDDLRGLSVVLRLSAQGIVVGLCLEMLFSSTLFFGDSIPYVLDHLIMGLFWVGFINIFNFMDGINGISVIEASSISLGIFLLGVVGPLPLLYGDFSLIILFSVLGFFVWNVRGKIFLGDVGSVPLGFLLGFLLVNLWVNHSVVSALVLPLYYVLDAGITIFRRLMRKEKIWVPHSQHFYQKAFRGQGGLSQILLTILLGNMLVLSTIIFLDEVFSLLLASVIGVIQIFVLHRYSRVKK